VRASVFPAAFFIFTILLTLAVACGPVSGLQADGVSIAKFRAEPATVIIPYGTDHGRATLNLTLSNNRPSPCNVTVTVSENNRTVETRALSIAGNSSLSLSIPWTVKGEGVHIAGAALGGGNETAPSNMTALCEVVYGRPVENPSPWYTIPCAFLFIIIPSIAIWLLIRRMKGGDWLERAGRR
jgi:hypothetical protein